MPSLSPQDQEWIEQAWEAFKGENVKGMPIPSRQNSVGSL